MGLLVSTLAVAALFCYGGSTTAGLGNVFFLRVELVVIVSFKTLFELKSDVTS